MTTETEAEIHPGIFDLKGRVAFVTGAGQGAGRAIALMLARHNAGGVAINDFVMERAEEVAREVRALGVAAIPVSCDVGDLDGVRRSAAEAEKALGPVALLVNNAGNAGPSGWASISVPFWESDPATWHRYFQTNLFGVMNCCHTLLPGMVAAGYGRVVTIVSDAGRVGEANMADYAAAKAAAAGFMRSLARDSGRYGITANAISLATLQQPIPEEDKAAFLASATTKARLSRYVIRRFGEPDDVAAMALFLCSDAASWITGQTYPVNGGYSLGL
jgi:NAD(P)-dependent dehydrogenase (short-subunit alcohol dehydrogenase family)